MQEVRPRQRKGMEGGPPCFAFGLSFGVARKNSVF